MSFLNQKIQDSVHSEKIYSDAFFKKKKIQHEDFHIIEKHWKELKKIHTCVQNLTQFLT